MEAIGELVRKAVDLVNSGSPEAAYFPAAASVRATGAKSSADTAKFVRQNWELIAFMGMPNALPIPMSLPFAVKGVISNFNVHHGAEELVATTLTETLRRGSLPPEFGVNREGKFEVREKKVLLPIGLLNGLLGAVIFAPVNRDEIIEGDYWIAISDFKMFISELWGRRDLADRIIRFYRR